MTEFEIVSPRRPDSKQRGYVLLLLLLMVCLLAIFAAAIAPAIAFEIKRDHEEELIHRGAAYSRAIRRYAKSNGRFPLDLEDLNGKNGIRYIRKLYKDPMTGQDFRLLYTRDILNATANAPQNGQPVQNNGDNACGDPNHEQNSTDTPASQQNTFTGNAVSSPGSQSSFSQTGGATPGGSAATIGSASSDGLTFGVFFGVASKSKEKTIREFEHKNHYNQWLFFYDQNHDTGFLFNGPTPLALPTMSQAGQSVAGAPSSALGQPGAAQQQPPPPATN